MHLKAKLIHEKIHWLDLNGGLKIKIKTLQNYWQHYTYSNHKAIRIIKNTIANVPELVWEFNMQTNRKSFKKTI
jgi:hypothetical protein